jgi:hypothetical protein
MRRIDQEEADRRTLDAAGWGGTAAGLAAGIIDPTMFIPGVAIAKAGRGGYSAMRVAGAAAVSGGVQAAGTEAALYATQETRSLEEVALNIGTGTLLAGLIGAGAGALLSREARVSLEGKLDLDRKAMADDLQSTTALTPSGAPMPAPAGAAAAERRTLELEGSFGVADLLNQTPGLNRIVGSPTARSFTSPFVSLRRSVADLAETALRFKDNREGIPTTQGPALDRSARLAQHQARVAINEAMDTQFTKYRFSESRNFLGQQVGKAVAAVEGARGTSTKLTPMDFRREVGKAMSRDDAHEIPEVAEAARVIRQQIKPWEDRAIKAGLIDEPTRSFFARRWDKTKINAQRPEISKRIADWYEREQTDKAAARARLASMNEQLRAVSGQVAKFEKRLETNTGRMADLESRLSERDMEVRRTEKRGDALAERAGSIAEEISEIEEFVAAMRTEVNDPAMLAQLDQLRADAADLKRADRPVTEADLRRLEDEELKNVLTGTARKAAEMLTGRRKWPKETFTSWIVMSGGINDTGGDFKTVMGDARARPGLLNKQGMSLDEWGEALMDRFPASFQTRPTENEVLRIFEETYRGKVDPDFWIENLPAADREGS